MKKYLISLCCLFCFVVWANGQTCKMEQTEIGMHHCTLHLPTNKKQSVLQGVLHNFTYAELNIWVDPAVRFLRGVVKHKVKLIDDANGLRLDLNDSLVVSSVLVNGVLATFNHNQAILYVNFGNTIPQGTTLELEVAYEGVPAVGIGFGSFMQDTHAGVPIVWTLSQPYGSKDWWPCQQTLGDKLDSIDIFIHHPNAYTAVSNGLLQSRLDSSNWSISHFSHRYPIVPYLVAFAVTNYITFQEQLTDGSNFFPVINYVFPEDIVWLREEFVHLQDQMTLFAKRFGPYPFAKEQYGHAQFTWGGGMEHQTMSFMFSLNFELMAHELAHQWFGNKITISSWADIWLHESLATWLSGLCYETLLDGFYWPLWRHNLKVAVTAIPDGSVYRLDTTVVRSLFSSRLAYRKGALVLHMLRYQLGDSILYAGLRQWLGTDDYFGFTNTDMLRACLEKVSGKDLKQFFKQWIYEEGYPNFHLKYYQRGHKLWVQAHQQRSVYYEEPMVIDFPFKAYNLISKDSMEFRFSFQNNQQWQSFDVPFGVDSLQFDPDSWILAGNSSIEKYKPIDFAVYPNPSKGVINLSWQTADNTQAVVTIFDLAGKRVHQERINRATENQIRLTHLSAGAYIIQVQSAEANIAQRLILYD